MTIVSWIVAVYVGLMAVCWPLSIAAGILIGYLDSDDSEIRKPTE